MTQTITYDENSCLEAENCTMFHFKCFLKKGHKTKWHQAKAGSAIISWPVRKSNSDDIYQSAGHPNK